MLAQGLRLVAGTFFVVALVLIGQVVDVTLTPIPKLNYALAACDPPATLGAWLAAIGARSVRERAPELARVLFYAALSLTLVATIVVFDFGLAYSAVGSAPHRIFTSQAAWIVVDVGTVSALGLLLYAPVADGAGSRPPSPLALTGAGLLLVRAVAAVWSVAASVPWPFRVAEATLFALVGIGCLRVAAREAPRV